MGIEREEYHHRMCEVYNRHSEWKARCSSVVFRAPSQPYVGAICSVLVAARSTTQHINVLAMIGARVAGWSNDLLAISVGVTGLRGDTGSTAVRFP